MEDQASAIDLFPSIRSASQDRGVVGQLLCMDFPAHDFTAVDVHNQVEIKEAPLDPSGQVGDVPGPNLLRTRCRVTGRSMSLGGPGRGAMPEHTFFFEKPIDGRFRGEIPLAIR